MSIQCPTCNTVNPDTAQYCRQCGHSLAAFADALPPGTTLDSGRYAIVKILGGGGMGKVYLAEDRRFSSLQRAVKEMITQTSAPDEYRQALERFQREAELLARLNHPHIPRVIDHFIEGDRAYLVMDYIEGQNLEEVVRHEGRPGLPEATVLRWAGQILDVLEFLHQQNIVFRDMKPSNVMRRLDGNITVIDFGIALHFVPQRQGTLIGSPGYAPFEQYQGRAEPRSDIYGLGATLHHLLSGDDPRNRSNFDFPPLRQLVPAISPITERALIQALEFEAKDRFASVAEMRQALFASATSARQSALPPTQPASSIPTQPASAANPYATRALAQPHVMRAPLHTGAVRGVAFGSLGMTVVSAGEDGAVLVAEVLRLQTQRTFSLGAAAWACAVSPNGQLIAAGGERDRVTVWATRDGREHGHFTTRDMNTVTLAFSPDNACLAIGGRYAPMGRAGGQVYIFDVSSGRRVTRIDHPRPFTSLAFHPNGSSVFTADREGFINIWRLGSGPIAQSSGEIATRLSGAHVACSPDGETLALAGGDGSLVIWHIGQRRMLVDSRPTLPLSALHAPRAPFSGPARPAPQLTAGVAYDPRGQRLAYTAPGHPVRLRSLVDGWEDELGGGGSEFVSLAFSPDGRSLAAGARDGWVWLWTVT